MGHLGLGEEIGFTWFLFGAGKDMVRGMCTPDAQCVHISVEFQT